MNLPTESKRVPRAAVEAILSDAAHFSPPYVLSDEAQRAWLIGRDDVVRALRDDLKHIGAQG